MANHQELAEALAILTGADFAAHDGIVQCKTALTEEQYALFERACQQSGLRVPTATDIRIAMDDMADPHETLERLAVFASLENERIARLEAARAILQRRTGAEFVFDDSHKILLSSDPLPDMHDPAARRQRSELVNFIADGEIEGGYLHTRDGQHRIVVYDILDMDLNIGKYGINEQGEEAIGTAVSRLTNRPALPRNDTPPRSSTGPGRATKVS